MSLRVILQHNSSGTAWTRFNIAMPGIDCHAKLLTSMLKESHNLCRVTGTQLGPLPVSFRVSQNKVASMDERPNATQMGEHNSGRETFANERRGSLLNETCVIERQRSDGNVLSCCKKSFIICGILSIILSLVFAFFAFLFLKNCGVGCEVATRASEVLRMFSGSLFVVGVILLIVRACQLGIEHDSDEFGSTTDQFTVVSVIPEEGLEKSPAPSTLTSPAYHKMPRVNQWSCLNEDGKVSCYDVEYDYECQLDKLQSLGNELQQKTSYETEPPPSYEQALQMVAEQR